MCRGWSWGNLGGDLGVRKQTEKKSVYLLTVAFHTVEKIIVEQRNN